MKKISLITAIVFILPIFMAEAQGLQYPAMNEYPVIKAGFIASGDAEQEVKCAVNVIGGGGDISPTTWTISSDGKMYIADNEKKRIAIYDLDGNYYGQVKIENDTYLLTTLSLMKVSSDGSIFCLNRRSNRLININQQGDLVFKIDAKPFDGIHNRFYLYENFVIYYDTHAKIKYISPTGKILTNEEFNNLQTTIKEKEKGKGIRSYADIQTKLDSFLQKKSLIYTEDILCTISSYTYHEFWNIAEDNAEYAKLKNDYWIKSIIKSNHDTSIQKIEKGVIIADFDMDEFRKSAGLLIGYDSDKNLIFSDLNRITVIDKYGSVLDSFKIATSYNYSSPQVAPNGNIYLWKITKEGVILYKILRCW